jgi:hypothetical protein
MMTKVVHSGYSQASWRQRDRSEKTTAAAHHSAHAT